MGKARKHKRTINFYEHQLEYLPGLKEYIKREKRLYNKHRAKSVRGVAQSG